MASFQQTGRVWRIGEIDGGYAVEFIADNTVYTYYLDMRSYRKFAAYIGYIPDDPTPPQMMTLTIENDWIIGWR